MAVAVIPTYNESENIKMLIERLETLKQYISNIIIVDDGSADGTESVATSSNAIYSDISVLQRGSKLGFGSAIRDGLREALKNNDAERFLQMDADLSHDPSYLPSMFDEKADIVIGSRYAHGGGTKGWTLFRRMSSRTAGLLASILLRLPAKDPTAGFKIYSRNAAQLIVDETKENKSMGAFEIETIYVAKEHGLKVAEVPINFVNRKKGASKAGFHEIYIVVKFILTHLF
jgi:dolichol-phosphate mannosyltransferase